MPLDVGLGALPGVDPVVMTGGGRAVRLAAPLLLVLGGWAWSR